MFSNSQCVRISSSPLSFLLGDHRVLTSWRTLCKAMRVGKMRAQRKPHYCSMISSGLWFLLVSTVSNVWFLWSVLSFLEGGDQPLRAPTPKWVQCLFWYTPGARNVFSIFWWLEDNRNKEYRVTTRKQYTKFRFIEKKAYQLHSSIEMLFPALEWQGLQRL